MVGLTATPQRHFKHRPVIWETDFDPPKPIADMRIRKLYSLLLDNQERYEQIVADVLMAMEEGLLYPVEAWTESDRCS